MFFLRVLFWLSVVVVLLPADEETGIAPRVAVGNAILAASATVTDFSGFCDRNPDLCVTGRAAVEAITVKAETGARDFFRYLGGEAEALPPEGTLSRDDLALPWNGPVADEPA